MERKVAIKNNTRSSFFYAIANRHVRREVPSNGILKVPFEELQEGLFEKGIMQAFKEGKLSIVEEQDAMDLELIPYAPKLTMDEKQILNTLTGSDTGAKFVMIRDANPTMKDLIISVVVENKLTDPDIVKHIKQYFNYDVLATIVKVQ